MVFRFEWDAGKSIANFEKHAVSFDEASTVFEDPLASTFLDPRHSILEERLVTIGLSHRRRLLVVMHTEQADVVEDIDILRIISARRATRGERVAYEEAL